MKHRKYGKKKDGVSKAVKSYVHKAIEAAPETKQLATSTASVVPISNTTGSVIVLNAIIGGAGGPMSQGAGDYQRIGSKIKIHKVQFQCTFELVGGAGIYKDVVRLMILREKAPEGVVLTRSELLTDIASTYSVSAPYNEKHRHRFEIYYDKTFDMSNQSGQAITAPVYKHIKFSKTFKKPVPATYYHDSSAAGVASIEQGAIMCIAWSTVPAQINMNTPVSNILFTDA